MLLLVAARLWHRRMRCFITSMSRGITDMNLNYVLAVVSRLWQRRIGEMKRFVYRECRTVHTTAGVRLHGCGLIAKGVRCFI